MAKKILKQYKTFWTPNPSETEAKLNLYAKEGYVLVNQNTIPDCQEVTILTTMEKTINDK